MPPAWLTVTSGFQRQQYSTQQNEVQLFPDTLSCQITATGVRVR